MSRHMQITVTIRPFYQKSFEKTYPRLARHLAYQDPDLMGKNPWKISLTISNITWTDPVLNIILSTLTVTFYGLHPEMAGKGTDGSDKSSDRYRMRLLLSP